MHTCVQHLEAPSDHWGDSRLFSFVSTLTSLGFLLPHFLILSKYLTVPNGTLAPNSHTRIVILVVENVIIFPHLPAKKKKVVLKLYEGSYQDPLWLKLVIRSS